MTDRILSSNDRPLTLSVLRASEHGFTDGDHLIMDGHEYSAEQVYDALHGLHTPETGQTRNPRDLIFAIDKIARDVCSYDYGLPVFNEDEMVKMSAAIEEWAALPALETRVCDCPEGDDGDPSKHEGYCDTQKAGGSEQ